MKDTSPSTAISFALAIGTLASAPIYGGLPMISPSARIESQYDESAIAHSPFQRSGYIVTDATQTTNEHFEVVSRSIAVLDFAKRMNESLVDMDPDIADAVSKNFWSLI